MRKGKFKTRLIETVKEEQKEAARQKKLHRKHKVKDDKVLVVEKNNMVKFTIRTAGKLIRTISTICLVVLAILGLYALIYPTIRIELIRQLEITAEDFIRLMGI